jgi:thiamine pyrophosphokinase
MVGARESALAISNFLRQHDLVQVQWVTLSSLSGAPQRDGPDLIESLKQVQDPNSAPLAFDGVLVVVGGGALDPHLLHRLAAEGAHLVGADGGGDIIRAAGLVPEAIIGDFDSLADRSAWDARTRLIPIAEQETTDFEKVLYSTTAPVTVGLGMTGKRFDHTLAALDAMARYAAARRIILVDEDDVALGLAGPFDFTVEPGARVSVHPLTPTRFARSAGLKYPLDNLLLAPGVRTGTSNEASEAAFSITPEAGDAGVYLLILERRWLETLIDRLLGD